jgi:hypothetical protein
MGHLEEISAQAKIQVPYAKGSAVARVTGLVRCINVKFWGMMWFDILSLWSSAPV